MGYRHSWTLADECDPIAFDRAVTDMDKVIKHLAPGVFDSVGGGRNGSGTNGIAVPYLKSDGVAITDPAAAGEVFRLNRDISLEDAVIRDKRARVMGKESARRGDFKPLGSPANIAVSCCLIILKRHLGTEIDVRSDVGGDGWARAAAVCQDVLGYGGSAAIGDDEVLRLDGNAGAGETQGMRP